MKKRYISKIGRFKAFAAAAAVVAAAAGAFAQDAASVPFKVNVAATVTASRGGASVSMDVNANEEKALTIPLGGVAVSYRGGARGQSNVSVIANSRGNITLRMPSESYKSADIAVYSVNGRQILRGRVAAAEAVNSVSRRNVAAGVYMLSVKGVSGNTFTTRLTHGGGNMNINAAFGAQNASSPERRLGKSAAEEGWRITVWTLNYKDSSYLLTISSGQNALQNITLTELSSVAVTFSGTGATVSPANFEGVTITGGHVVLDIPSSPTEYNITVSGTTANGSLKIYNRFNLTLHLNGVNITNPTGPAVNIQNPGTSVARPVSVNVTGTNVLADGAVYNAPQGTEQAKGTFFSERRTTFRGGGALEVSSKGHHAMVVDNDVFFNNANIKITEANDGIHANDSIVINGGAFDITSKGEAIQNEKPGKAIVISGAKINIATTDVKSHGISSDESNIVINGNSGDTITVRVTGDGSKGLRSRGNMQINGGVIRVSASGGRHIDNSVSPIDTSNSAGIKVEGDLEVKGGTIQTVCTKEGGNGKGINVNGNLTISGGNINANANGDGIKVDGNLVITGGTTYARSATTQDADVTGTITVTAPGTLDAPKRN